MTIPFWQRSGSFPLLVCLCLCGCAAEGIDPEYQSYRSLVEVVAALENDVDADLYRFQAPTEVTGENLFRVSLARLQRIEKIVPDPGFRPGIRFAMARARERLLDFGTAAELYGEVATGEGALARRARELEPLARALAGVDRELAEIWKIESLKQVREGVAAGRRELQSIQEGLDQDPRRCLVNLLIERLDVREREFLWRARSSYTNGTRLALDAARRVVSVHVESRRYFDHSLRLGDLYAELARSYVASVDPADIAFNAVHCRNLIQAAFRAYSEVASVDGQPERQEARAALVRMEALIDRLERRMP